MSFTTKDWRDLPAELEPDAGESVADWFARIAAYDVANPGVLTFINAAALEDVEARLSDYTDQEAAAATDFLTASGLTLSGTHTSAIGSKQWLTTAGTLTANHVETITGTAAGKFVLFGLKQDATGNRTFSVTDANNAPAALTVNSAAGAVTDILVYYRTATDLDIIYLGGNPASQAASAISYAGSTNLSATNVEAALDELDTEKASTGSVTTVSTGLSDHLADTTDAHAGSAITNTPAGAVAATTVQGAINELDTEKADKTVSINAQAGTSYTLVLGDAGKLITVSNAGTHTLTVPTNASVAFPVGTVVNIARIGAGAVNVAAAGGVTVNSPGGLLGARAQYSQLTLIKTATDTWLLGGDLA